MVADGIIRVGGVGTGRIFQFAHSRTYPQFIEKAWLTGFYDLNPVTAQAALDQYAGLLKAYAAEHPLHAERVARNLDEASSEFKRPWTIRPLAGQPHGGDVERTGPVIYHMLICPPARVGKGKRVGSALAKTGANQPCLEGEIDSAPVWIIFQKI